MVEEPKLDQDMEVLGDLELMGPGDMNEEVKEDE